MSIRKLLAATGSAVLLIAVLGLGASARTETAAGPRVDCASCLIVADDGSTLWSRSPHVRRPIASTTKMVTALVVVETADLDEEIRVSERAAATPGGRFSLQAGDEFTVRDLLFALLLGSSNDAAVALAEHVAGSEESFVRRINQAVRRLGARRTTFTSSHGLDDEGLSTAADLALIGAALLEDRVLAEIVSTSRAEITGSGGSEIVENTNELLEGYEGLLGIKTGFTAGAGNVLVAAAERQGRRVITVAMDSEDAFVDSRRLLNYGFRLLGAGVLVDEGEGVGAIVFDPAGVVSVVAADAIRGLPLRQSVRLKLHPGEGLRPPFARGDQVGTVVVTMDGRVIGRAEAVAATDVTAGAPGWPERSLSFVIRICARVFPGGGG